MQQRMNKLRGPTSAKPEALIPSAPGEERSTWVIQFDCGEAMIVERRTRAEAWTLHDDRGCLPQAVYAPEEVILAAEPWTKNGQLRCTVAEVLRVREECIDELRGPTSAKCSSE